MYFSGTIEVDPTQFTTIKRVKPTKLFGKVLDALTFGQMSDKQEHETFTALAILQQLNMGLRSLNIKNVIRLSVNEYDFYLDEKGLDDDLSDAMLEVKAKIDPLESEVFQKIYIVLEHLEGGLKSVIEMSVRRKHKVGEYPLKIVVNSVISDFKMREGEGKEDIERRMGPIFESQDAYDKYLQMNKIKFDQFMENIELAIRKSIKVDDIRKTTNTQIIRPKKKIERREDIRHTDRSQPVYYGYYGINDYFFYAMVWSTFMYSHNIYTHDVHIVDETGHDVMAVGEEGFNAGESNTLNPEAEFEPPAGGDVEYFDDNEYQADLENSNLLTQQGGEGEIVDSDWLDDTGVESGDTASCSSCGSCGGCGD